MQLFVLSLGRGCCVSCSLVLGFVFWGFFTFMMASIFISHLGRRKYFCLCSWMCCFLSAVGAAVKTVGCQGWNLLTKISCQVKISERIRYLSVAAIHRTWNLHVCSQCPWQGVPYPAESLTPLGSRGSGPFRSVGQQTGSGAVLPVPESKQ